MKQNQLSYFWSNFCVLNPKGKENSEHRRKMCNKPTQNWDNELKMLIQHKIDKEIIVETTDVLFLVFSGLQGSQYFHKPPDSELHIFVLI